MKKIRIEIQYGFFVWKTLKPNIVISFLVYLTKALLKDDETFFCSM